MLNKKLYLYIQRWTKQQFAKHPAEIENFKIHTIDEAIRI